jgi:DNA mismatch repair protein MutS
MCKAVNQVKITPMIRQYASIKEQYKDYILLYRMGDFYEMFFDDAKTASRALEITLTARNKNDEQPVPMCGVPVKAVDVYIGRLLEQGYKVAICEQMEDPAKAKGLVRRDVVRVITPGMVVNNELLDETVNNFVVSISRAKDQFGISCLDLSTAAFRVSQTDQISVILEESLRIDPNEIILSESSRNDPQFKIVIDGFSGKAVTFLPDSVFEFQIARKRLLDQFNTRSLEGFGCEHLKAGVAAAGAIVYYIRETQKQEIRHLTGLETYSFDRFMLIDDVSCRNLELIRNIRNGAWQGSLLGVIDKTVTAMGARLLKSWLRYPLLDSRAIDRRLDAVAEAKQNAPTRMAIRSALKSVSDMERLGSKIALGQATARDLVALKRSIFILPEIITHLAHFNAPLLKLESSLLAPLINIAELIDAAIEDDPPYTTTEGGMIKKGYHAELDELMNISKDGKKWLAELEAREKGKTGIHTLKVRYNKIFGYYIEITKSYIKDVPVSYIRKQTLVNAERYITDELKIFEEKVLGAEEKRANLEYELFVGIREQIVDTNLSVMECARFIARIDCLLSMAEIADRYDYCRPGLTSDGVIHIEDGRHPVVEKLIFGERFVPNTIHMDNSDNQVLIITGPNMAGKSTVLRQVALIVLMAQMGSFVPAAHAAISLTDRIFTRVGALDNLSQGQSTFMVEMEEAANIMNNASPSSLVVMDEIGRGTSTFDGLSIAWAVAEYLHDLKGAGVKTLFATHYHELTDLVQVKPRVKNFNIAVKEWNDEIIFLHKIIEGGTNRSYGIQVARLAGVPDKVIKRAKEVLSSVEKFGHVLADAKGIGTEKKPKNGGQVQLSLFKSPEQVIMEKLKEVDIATMTPLDALNAISAMKRKAGFS